MENKQQRKKKKKTRPKTRKTNPISEPIFQVKSGFRQSNQIPIGSGFGSQETRPDPISVLSLIAQAASQCSYLNS